MRTNVEGIADAESGYGETVFIVGRIVRHDEDGGRLVEFDQRGQTFRQWFHDGVLDAPAR